MPFDGSQLNTIVQFENVIGNKSNKLSLCANYEGYLT